MHTAIVISPDHGTGWYVDIRERHGRRIGLSDRAAAEEFARRYIAEHWGGRGNVLVLDAYHRVIGHTRYRAPAAGRDPAKATRHPEEDPCPGPT